ncbi:MAG: efflux RND transporter periplasmic adaptor subunit [Solidesulfovibrio sp.]|uniref:efflux RND transporter periplasmic adaptor subunit n=1 Tax=Solidesulfovibrio sp. TaxID=2910990 RepID=UPI002B1F0DDB|nr:efflux RND transporter periplasmic adaptor subunit [Solidesulfovibrio sp.]MEA4858030.1 efflux RND transporter periplasmic adaptor subunit [Solidesulfovibrio sp.]
MPSLSPRPVARIGLASALALCAALLLSGCGQGEADKKQAATPSAAPPAVLVTAQRPVVADVPIVIEYVGRLAAKENIEVRARVEGYLKERLFTEGAMVKQGDVLFVIESRQYMENLKKAQAELARQQALLSKAQVDFTRFEQLYKQKAVSRDEYDTKLTNQREIAANLDSAKAAVETAERDLGYTKVTAPITGRIGKALVNVGNLVGKGDNTLLAEISSTDPIYVDFSISERDYLEFTRAMQERGGKEGEPRLSLTLILADDSVYPQKGVPDMAERAVDAKTGTLGVRGVFANPRGLLKPGQFAKVRALIDERKGALLVPQRAIVDVQGSKSVYVVGPGDVIEAKAVTLGGSKDGSFVIDTGLTPDDRVVVEGVSKVRPGMTVKVAEDAPPAATGTAAAPAKP